MKLALGPVRMMLAAAVALSSAMGCAGSSPASPRMSVPVGTTSLTSAIVAPSTLAPAAWEGDEPIPAAAPAAPTTPTWGAPAATTAQSSPIAPNP